MPKSSNKRKNGKKVKSMEKTYYSPFKVTQAMVNEAIETFERFELVIEMKLPFGNADLDDMYCIRDIFNLAQIALLSRDWIEQKDKDEFLPLFIEAAWAVHDSTMRASEAGRKTITCKGDELQKIRDFAIPAAALIKDSFETCPRRMIKEWRVMQLIHEKNGGHIQMSEVEIKRLLDSIVGKAGNYINWRKK